MANTNDLRFIKTERLIEDTYIALKKKSRSPVKVSELCRTALINKSTFYTHYETMDALHEHICEKHIDAILNDCPHIDEAFTDTSAFVRSVVQATRESVEISYTLFAKDTMQQTNAFEACLLKRYLHGDESEERQMIIIFAMGGAARLLVADQSDERIEMTIRLIERLLVENE